VGFFFKLLLKAGFTIGVMVIGYKFILPSIMGTGGFQMPNIANDAANGLDELSNSVTQKDVTVYQWVDDNGVTHYGGTPPAGQGAYEEKTIHADTNLVQAQKARETEEKQQQRSRTAKIGSIYSPEGIKNTLDGARDLQNQANDRTAEQERILNEIMGQQSANKKR